MVVVGTWGNMLQLLLRVSRAVNFLSKSPRAVLTFWHCLHSAVHRPSAWLDMIFVIACFLPSITQKCSSTLLKLESSNSCLISPLFTPFFYLHTLPLMLMFLSLLARFITSFFTLVVLSLNVENKKHLMCCVAFFISLKNS